MKYSNWQDIPQFPQAYYHIDVPLDYLKDCLKQWDSRDMGNPLILNPEWQRGHVWTEEQQIKFMEFFLMGGTTGSNIWFNCSSWQGAYNTPTYCLDGLQRITSAIRFLDNEIPAFGTLYKDFTGKMRGLSHCRFHFNMLCIKNKKELLKIYVMFNSGGTIHKPEEIERIKKMIDETPEDATL